jgi:type VI secretion system secreted protein VgrG
MSIYMKVSAPGSSIRGDSTFPGHDGWIALETFDVGRAPSGVASYGDGDFDPLSNAPWSREEGAAQKLGTTVTITKLVDIASPKLMGWIKDGDARRVQIEACDPKGQANFGLDLGGARLSVYRITGEDRVGNATEELQITWSKIKVTTRELSETGAPVGGGTFELERPPKPKSVGALTAAAAAAVAATEGLPPPPKGRDIQRKRKLVVGDVDGKSFELIALSGSEGMSRNFAFDLQLVSSELDLRARDVVGKPVSFKLTDEDDIESDAKSEDRLFHGRVWRFSAEAALEGKRRRYRMELAPWLQFLSKRSDCRVFQNKSALEIVEQVCTDAGFSDHERSRAMATYPKLEYCLQYRETDLDFVTRLLEENGISYFFRHEADRHVLVFADSTSAYAACARAEVVHSTGDVDQKHVYSWQRSWELVAKKAALRDYNYEKLSENLHVEEEVTSQKVDLTGTDKLILFDYPGAYGKNADGKMLAKARIEAEEAAHEVAGGNSNCDEFAVGLTFKFSKHENEAEEGREVVVMAISHSAEQLSDCSPPAVRYDNHVECLPASVPFRPRRTTRRPLITGPQTALVVGTSGEEIETDALGRIKIQFHWDRVGKKDENSSCWIRVAQLHTGTGWGMVALPRVGQEVVVIFLDGDPDRPLVVGSVYNENAKPAELPAKKNVTLLRTRSTKQGAAENANELAFDDTKDSEKILFHAEKDFEREVEHDDKLTIGKDGEGSRTVLIEKDLTVTVNKGHRVQKLTEGNDTLTVEKGDRTVEVKTGKETVTIKGDRSITVQSGNQTLSISEGKFEITAKSGYALKVENGKVEIEGAQGIELKCSSSSIKIESSGITIDASSLKLTGSANFELSGGGGKVEASQSLVVKGATVAIN